MPTEKPKTVKVKAKRDFPYRLTNGDDAPVHRAKKGKEIEVMESSVAQLRKTGRID